MTADVDAVFAALADRTRRELFQALARHGPCTATELASERAISRQAVAKHLGVLDGAGLASAQRTGREMRFRATPAALDAARRWIDETGAAWEQRLSALGRHLEE
jgi:DNA-binding transcriptional ArsR family regulator